MYDYDCTYIFTLSLHDALPIFLGTKIVIIDPEEEYVDLCEELGGQYIKLSTTSKDVINPLDIYEGMESHDRSEEHTSELQSRSHLVCRLLLEKKKIVDTIPICI